MAISKTEVSHDKVMNGKRQNSKKTSNITSMQSKAKTTTTRAKSTTAKPKKAPAAPKMALHADEPPRAPIFAPKAPESPRWESCVASWADEPQCASSPNDTFQPEPPSRGNLSISDKLKAMLDNEPPSEDDGLFDVHWHVHKRLCRQYAILCRMLEGRNRSSLNIRELWEMASSLAVSVNFYIRVYTDLNVTPVPIPSDDPKLWSTASDDQYVFCTNVVMAALKVALKDIPCLVNICMVDVDDVIEEMNASTSTNTGMDKVPF